jgi:hypothetical protein
MAKVSAVVSAEARAFFFFFLFGLAWIGWIGCATATQALWCEAGKVSPHTVHHRLFSQDCLRLTMQTPPLPKSLECPAWPGDVPGRRRKSHKPTWAKKITNSHFHFRANPQ